MINVTQTDRLRPVRTLGSSTTRAFTLVELAIVIVIAGILAAVSIPIYWGIVNASKWAEAETTVGSLDARLESVIGENSNSIPANIVDLPSFLLEIEYPIARLNTDHFTQGDYSLTITSYEPPAYLFVVDTALSDLDPPGRFTLDQNGATTRTY